MTVIAVPFRLDERLPDLELPPSWVQYRADPAGRLGTAWQWHPDVDVIDPRVLAGLLFPVPDGPPLPAVAAAVRRVLAACDVAAIGPACTWKPGSGTDRVVAGLARELSSAI